MLGRTEGRYLRERGKDPWREATKDRDPCANLLVRHMLARHGAPDLIRPGSGERLRGQRPLDSLDIEMIPHVWRDPDEVLPGNGAGEFILKKAMHGRVVLVAGHRDAKNSQAIRVKTVYIQK